MQLFWRSSFCLYLIWIQLSLYINYFWITCSTFFICLGEIVDNPPYFWFPKMCFTKMCDPWRFIVPYKCWPPNICITKMFDPRKCIATTHVWPLNIFSKKLFDPRNFCQKFPPIFLFVWKLLSDLKESEP